MSARDDHDSFTCMRIIGSQLQQTSRLNKFVQKRATYFASRGQSNRSGGGDKFNAGSRRLVIERHEWPFRCAHIVVTD